MYVQKNCFVKMLLWFSLLRSEGQKTIMKNGVGGFAFDDWIICVVMLKQYHAQYIY